jgi:hypothetical protein
MRLPKVAPQEKVDEAIGLAKAAARFYGLAYGDGSLKFSAGDGLLLAQRLAGQSPDPNELLGRVKRGDKVAQRALQIIVAMKLLLKEPVDGALLDFVIWQINAPMERVKKTGANATKTDLPTVQRAVFMAAKAIKNRTGLPLFGQGIVENSYNSAVSIVAGAFGLEPATARRHYRAGQKLCN